MLDSDQFVNIIEAVIQASLKTMEYYQNDNLKVEIKSDQSPVTLADKAANDILIKALTKITPNIPIITEESPVFEYDKRKGFATFWLVDPLDGTKEFIKGGDDFTVNVGLIHNNIPVFGVVSVPVLSQLYYGSTFSIGESKIPIGSYTTNYKNGFRLGGCIAIRCTEPDLGSTLRVITSRSHMNQETMEFLDTLPDPKTLVSLGSSLKIIAIASNEADLYPRIGLTSEWDTAAAHAILNAAGGELRKLTRGNVVDEYYSEPFCYNKSCLLNPYFICGHSKLLDAFAPKER